MTKTFYSKYYQNMARMGNLENKEVILFYTQNYN